jgi:hypothetical protein
MIINQVGTGGTASGKYHRRAECGYATYDRETLTYEIRLSDHTLIGEINTDGGYHVTDIDDDRGIRKGAGTFPTITQALRELFGKPGYGYSWYELA